MSLTGGHEAAFELREEVVRDIFFEAWRSGGIPHEIRSDGTVAGYSTHAIVQITEAGMSTRLDLRFDTSLPSGVRISLPLDLQITVDSAPAPSINPIAFACALDITAPLQALPDARGNRELVLNLAGLPDSQVAVVMPAEPVISVTAELIEDGLHKAYDDGVIPHSVPYSWGGTTIQIDVEDDDADPGRQIRFTLDAADRGTVTLPLFIHVAGGIEQTVLVHNVKLVRSGDTLKIRFSDVQAADIEASALLSPYSSLIATMVRSYGEYPIFVPGNDTIAGLIRDAVQERLDTWGADGDGKIHIFTPNAVENSPIEIVDFTPVVKPGFLAVLFNPMTGVPGVVVDASAVENFIPDGKKFAQCLAEPVVQRMIDQALQEKILDENGCGGWPCTFDHEIEGHEVTLTSEPRFTFHDGYIQMNGSATVAIDCWFDPDVDYEAKVKFHFETDESGNKVIKPDVYDEDVDLSCLDWFLGLIILIYGWICLIVVTTVIDAVGGEVVEAEGDKIAEGTKYMAGEIHGVGQVTTELDRIDIKPGGIILSGGVFVVSSHYPLTYAPSESTAPYRGWAASPIGLDAIDIHPRARYQWKFGDGASAEGAHVGHAYVRDGIYLVDLTVTVPEPRGSVTHHVARVRVDNVPPSVEAGPAITADEGETIRFDGQFTDVEWGDRHEAVWQWGDDTMEQGVVAETNFAPRAEGIVTGSHAFGSSGEFAVALRVRDNDGGVGRDTKRVTVRNVPPRVDAGPDLYAYPGIPVTLKASFTDPGWLDRHTAWWETGDANGPRPMPALVREVNEPPAGYGYAAFIHIYHTLGTFLAECTVVDSDGASGRDTLPVRVVDVVNGDFEGGFRDRIHGAVANGWDYYVGGASDGMTGRPGLSDETAAFQAEEFVVRAGQRSQRVNGRSGSRSGLCQKIGANRGWDYQVTAWYHLDERASGVCRLGLDPAGGTDPSAATVVWAEGREHRRWAPLVVRASAAGTAVSIFLDARSEKGDFVAWFDAVSLIPYPCPPGEPDKPLEPEKPREICVDWKTEPEQRTLPPVYTKEGFAFRVPANANLRIVRWGVPQGEGKLNFPGSGMQVTPPFIAGRAVAWAALYAGKSIVMEAFDASGQKIGEASSPSAQGTVHMLEVRAPGIETLKISGGGSEGLLVRLCAYSGPEKEPGPVKPRPGKRVPAGTAKAAKNSPAGKG
jgi:hypothetical protein